jgi:hypothetical protein
MTRPGAGQFRRPSPAVAKAVSHRPLTAEAWVPCKCSPCEVYGGQIGTGWWRQYAPLKRQSSTRLHSAISQKAVIFISTAVSTWNLTYEALHNVIFYILIGLSVFQHPDPKHINIFSPVMRGQVEHPYKAVKNRFLNVCICLRAMQDCCLAFYCAEDAVPMDTVKWSDLQCWRLASKQKD